MTRVVVIKCFCSLSDPHGHDGLYTRHLLSEDPCPQLLFSSDRRPYDSVFHQSVILVADPILRHNSIHVRPSPH